VLLTASAIGARIPDDRTAILEFVGGASGSPTTVFIVQRAGIRARTLPPIDSLSERVARFVALLESGGEPDLPARWLGTTVLEPVLAEVGAEVSRLVIVPDGALHHVPWDALRLGDGRYLAERYAVSVAPSAGVVATLWSRAGERAAPRVRGVSALAFGDPAFARDPGDRADASPQSVAAETYRSAFDSSGGLPRLRASADEARLVARYAPRSVVRLREAASAAFLRHAALKEFRIIHFATHALVDERSAARTALALAPGDGESGFVGPGDLAALRLDADLVVLSACRTARGRVVEGEGVQGLTAPLLQAGARSVVATRWRIGDRSTVAFVDDFYRGLARGLPVGEALRAAKVAAMRRNAPAREWAVFTAVGDPLVSIALREPPPLSVSRTIGLGALALGLVGIAVYAVRARRAALGARHSALGVGTTY
jgi:hypothetical protein